MLTERGFESASKVWSGSDILVIFHGLGITAGTFNILKVLGIYLSFKIRLKSQDQQNLSCPEKEMMFSYLSHELTLTK